MQTATTSIATSIATSTATSIATAETPSRFCQLLQTPQSETVCSVRVKFEKTGELTLCSPTNDSIAKDVTLFCCHPSTSLESLKRSLIFRHECGINHEQFFQRSTSLTYLLGAPVIFPNSTAYFQSRRLWKKMNRRVSLTNWDSTFSSVDDTPEKRRLSFAPLIDVTLIPTKEGDDFDIDDETSITCADYELLNTPLMPEENYEEYWTTSPFPQDNGRERPFYHNKKDGGPKGWCLCKRPPTRISGRMISCRKCLNLELRKFVRKCTPEEFQDHHMKKITDDE